MITLPRNAQIWLPGLIASRLRKRREPRPSRVFLMIADHFEPLWNQADEEAARERVALWRRRWPEIAAQYRDSAGRPPCYTFFYPAEKYRPALLDPLAELARAGIADVEVHLHHDGQGEQHFRDQIGGFTETLFTRHGLLRREAGKLRFGFIHGNWALDNSRPDGRWCGLNNEITLLRDLGCYADFTLPSAPEPTQTRIVNTIYFAKDDPQRPKSHDSGVPARPGMEDRGDLLMIPGPLTLDWTDRKIGLFPRLDVGELAGYNRFAPHRLKLWLETAPRLAGNVFIKLFTHGAQERNSSVLLEADLDRLFMEFRRQCAALNLEVFFVSAWETYRAIDAILAGADPAAALSGLTAAGGAA